MIWTLVAAILWLSPVACALEVEVFRDLWGVPHVFAETDAGAFYGLGYATAEDRAFQMTYSLRIVQGRLSEAIGQVNQVGRRETVQAAIAMMRARNAVEFDAALAGWRFPSANMVFGDRDGNIGYRTVAAIPVRSRLDPAGGRHARPGHTQEQDWQELLPPGLLPGVINPADPHVSAPDWIRAGVDTNRPIWGLRGGLLWGLPSGAGGRDGPRGLIRLRYPTLPGGEYDLINFIAIEPVVRGHRGFSELERSRLDGVQGKRLWAKAPAAVPESPTNLVNGRLARLDTGAECLSVDVAVERFDNGAHVGLSLSQSSAAPDELELVIHAEPDSAPIDYCILTATMGNKARARQLGLKDGPVSSLDLFPDYRDSGFAAHRLFSLERLCRTPANAILAAITTDEADPAAVDVSPAAAHWRYRGFPVTQFWRKPAGAWRDDLQVAVNGRYTYWMSRHPIPGGVAFENFEMRERFYPGQRFVFGIAPASRRPSPP